MLAFITKKERNEVKEKKMEFRETFLHWVVRIPLKFLEILGGKNTTKELLRGWCWYLKCLWKKKKVSLQADGKEYANTSIVLPTTSIFLQHSIVHIYMCVHMYIYFFTFRVYKTQPYNWISIIVYSYIFLPVTLFGFILC